MLMCALQAYVRTYTTRWAIVCERCTAYCGWEYCYELLLVYLLWLVFDEIVPFQIDANIVGKYQHYVLICCYIYYIYITLSTWVQLLLLPIPMFSISFSFIEYDFMSLLIELSSLLFFFFSFLFFLLLSFATFYCAFDIVCVSFAIDYLYQTMMMMMMTRWILYELFHIFSIQQIIITIIMWFIRMYNGTKVKSKVFATHRTWQQQQQLMQCKLQLLFVAN